MFLMNHDHKYYDKVCFFLNHKICIEFAMAYKFTWEDYGLLHYATTDELRKLFQYSFQGLLNI